MFKRTLCSKVTEDRRMGNYIPLILTTLVYISLFVYVIASTQLEQLREDWNTVRCQPLAMFFASYIPTDPSVNRAKFSNDNFQFCMGGMMDDNESYDGSR